MIRIVRRIECSSFIVRRSFQTLLKVLTEHAALVSRRKFN